MKRYRIHLVLCTGTACVSNNAFNRKETLESEVKKHNLDDEVMVVFSKNTSKLHASVQDGQNIRILSVSVKGNEILIKPRTEIFTLSDQSHHR